MPLFSTTAAVVPPSPPGPQTQTRVFRGISGLLLHGDGRDTADPVADSFPISRRCRHPPTPLGLQLQHLEPRQLSATSISLPKLGETQVHVTPHHKTISSIRRGIVYILITTVYPEHKIMPKHSKLNECAMTNMSQT